MNVGPADAHLTDTNSAVVSSGFGAVWPSSNDGVYDIAWFPVHFPIGATITRIDNWGYTEDTDDSVSINLYRSKFDSESGTGMATCIYNNGSNSCADASVTDPVVTNGYNYILSVEVLSSDSVLDAKWFHTIIEYTTTNMSMTQ